MSRFPRTWRDFNGDTKGFIILRRRNRIGKVIDEFFDPHRITWRQTSGINHPTHIAIRRGVHIESKGRQRLAARRTENMIEALIVDFATNGCGRHGRCFFTRWLKLKFRRANNSTSVFFSFIRISGWSSGRRRCQFTRKHGRCRSCSFCR